MLFSLLDTLRVQLDDPGNTIITIYQGSIPATTDGFTAATHSGDLLATLTNFGLVVNDTNPSRPVLEYDSGNTPDPANASQTGTAAWFALFNPSDETRVIFGEVVDSGEGGLVVDDVSFVSGNSIGTTTLGITGTVD